jgi:glycine cleavage system aminomethyltransferase T
VSDAGRYDRPRRPDEQDPHAFFGERGYELVHHVADDLHWVDLVASENEEFRVRRYGRGGDPTRAALAAMRRWIVEQGT